MISVRSAAWRDHKATHLADRLVQEAIEVLARPTIGRTILASDQKVAVITGASQGRGTAPPVSGRAEAEVFQEN